MKLLRGEVRKLGTIIAAITAAVAIASPAMAQLTPYYVAGDFNGWNAAGNVMTETSPGDNIWQVSLTLDASARHEFKVTEGDWSWSVPGSGNSWLLTDGAGNVTLTYNANTYADGWSPAQGRIGSSVDPGTWTAVGDWQSWNNTGNSMTSLGGGVYEFSATLAPNTYQYKAVDTGTWDAIGLDSRGVNAATLNFTTSAEDPTANFYVNALDGSIKVDVVPEPSTLMLVGAGLLGALALRRRKA